MFFRKQKQAMKPVRNYSRPRKGPAHPLFRPRLEVLEDRCVPSTTNIWTSTGVDNLWNDPSNWSLGHEPNSTEVAFFDSSSSIPCTIDNSAQDTASGIFISYNHFGDISLGSNLTLRPDCFYPADSYAN